MQTLINPTEQNNDHTQIKCGIQFRSSFKVLYLSLNYSTKIYIWESDFNLNSSNVPIIGVHVIERHFT